MSRPEHVMAGRALRFGLHTEIERLRAEMAAGTGAAGRNAITLVKEGPLRVVLVVLATGSVMDEHATPGPATVQVLEGRMRIGADQEECVCTAGGLVVFDRGVAHTVTAEAGGALLLTVVDPRAGQSSASPADAGSPG